MSRLSFVLMSFAMVSPALAVQPTVEHLAVQIAETTIAGSTWTSALGTTRTVTVPTGKAVITWTVAPIGIVYARPFIGGARMADADAPIAFGGLGMGSASHSWSTPVSAGEITVGLEILQFDTSEAGVGGSMSWTLVVYPDEPAIPAVSGLGLGVLVVALLGAGGTVMRRRKTTVS